MIDMRRVRLFGIGAAAAPMIALVGVRIMGDRGPASASADPPADVAGTTINSVRNQHVTDEERAAVMYAETISSRAITGSPFYYPPAQVIDSTPIEPTTPYNEPAQLDRFEIRLSSVIGWVCV